VSAITRSGRCAVGAPRRPTWRAARARVRSAFSRA
jgi:hypothetical protein